MLVSDGLPGEESSLIEGKKTLLTSSHEALTVRLATLHQLFSYEDIYWQILVEHELCYMLCSSLLSL